MDNKFGSYYVPHDTDFILCNLITKIQTVNGCDYDKAVSIIHRYIDTEYDLDKHKKTKHKKTADLHYRYINYPIEY